MFTFYVTQSASRFIFDARRRILTQEKPTMSFRATQTAILTFGLVTIPMKLYKSASPNTVSFNMISPDGNRVHQKLVDAITAKEVRRDETRKGYEYAKDKYVTFTQEEAKALDSTDTSKTIDIQEFVNASEIDAMSVEKTHFLGPDKGGDRGYVVLARALLRMGKVAVAQWTSHGKERVVIVRPYRKGLILQELYYADEQRDIEEVVPGEVKISQLEEEMAEKLIAHLESKSLDMSKYTDRYTKRVLNAVDKKVAGQPVDFEPSPVPATALDLFAALKASLEGQNG